MAFVRSESWEGDSGRSACAGGTFPVFPLPRGSAALISLLVHLLLLWVFATRLAAGLAHEEEKPRPALKLFEVGTTAPPAEPAAPTKAAPARAAPAAAASALNVTVTNTPPLPEWSVSPMAAAVESAEPSDGAPDGASGAAGSGVHDPYAGAAPVRRLMDGAASRELDLAALEAVRISVSRSIRSGHGTALVAVRVSAAGIVLAAFPKGGSASPEAMRTLRAALVGKRLYRGSSREATHALPVVELRSPI